MPYGDAEQRQQYQRDYAAKLRRKHIAPDGARLAFVYSLSDSSGVRYIGKTLNPEHRYAAHLSEAKRGKRGPVYDWIRELIGKGATPIWRTLCECRSGEEHDQEAAHIEAARARGCSLVNLTNGGKGNRGWSPSEQTRQRMRQGSALRWGQRPDPQPSYKGPRRRRPWPEYAEEDHGYDTPCWIWLGVTNEKGYGNITTEGRSWRAHVLYFVRYVGPVPEGHEIDHLCNVRCCVNPAHLQPVTHADNSRRSKTVLLREHIDEIRKLHAAGQWTQKQIAKRFQCSPSAVGALINGRTWKEFRSLG